jgi:hypothetical protein
MLQHSGQRPAPAFAPPISYLPKQLRTARQPLVAIALGWLTAFVPSILLGLAVTRLMPALPQPDLKVTNLWLVAMMVVMAPLVETAIMAAVLSVLLRFVTPTVAVLVSAIGWGIAHSMAAPAWGLVVWWPFLIFSTLYVVWRQRSLLAAIAVPASVHALQNLAPAISLLLASRS